MAKEHSYQPGITIRSVCASLLAMILMVVILVFAETIEGSGWFYGMHILAIPAMAVFLMLVLSLTLFYVVFRIRLLTQAEIVCVFFSLLIAVPIMSLGFWTNYIWLSSTIPAQGDFEKIDAVSDKFWPHGPNLLADAFSTLTPDIQTQGDVQWHEAEYEKDVRSTLPLLTNHSQNDESYVRVRVPIERQGEPFLTLGERYLLSVLARGKDLGAGAVLRCRIYYDGNPSFDVEAFVEPRPVEKVTFLHKKGFRRFGVYGLEFSNTVEKSVNIEFQFSGSGTLELADPKLMSVAAFESLAVGRQAVSETEYNEMRPCERAAYIMKPDSMWSWAGARSILAGYLPVRQWQQPVAVWLAFISLLLLATFSVAIVMRRQWVKNERYPLPLVRIPLALLGVDDEDGRKGIIPSIWRNRTMWLGFALCLGWCLMRAWHAYNRNVPNMDVDVRLKPYLDDPGWGRMWSDVSFSICAVVLSIGVFMELNVLLSLVIGFFLFRSLHWLGEAYGWNIASDTGKFGIGQYPYGDEQMISAYITYGLLTLFFVRKYLWQVLKLVIKGERGQQTQLNDTGASDEQELFSYRTAFLMFVAAFAGMLVWAKWVDISLHAMAFLFFAMVLIGFVAMKLRAECGTPFGWFAPGTRLLVPLFGGMAFFGAKGTMLASWTTVGMVLLFIIPGLQMEFIEVARRARIRSRHVFYTLVIGVLGGMMIGGWFLLSSMYGMGSNNVTFGYWFTPRPFEFYPYIEAQRNADAALTAQLNPASADSAVASPAGGINPATWGYVGAAVATAAVTILRQWFPGFWFHPIAIILGGTANGLGMMMYWSFNIWGSLLAAWAIRLTVLKVGGASAVRNVLFPFFIGVFIAAIFAQLLLFGLNAYFYFFDISMLRQGPVF